MADFRYINNIFSENDLLKYTEHFTKEIKRLQLELNDFVNQGKERIKTIEEYNKNNQFKILGKTYKNGRKKNILLIKRYVDNSQLDERYSFEKISELRIKLVELEEKYNGVDWSMFEEEI